MLEALLVLGSRLCFLQMIWFCQFYPPASTGLVFCQVKSVACPLWVEKLGPQFKDFVHELKKKVGRAWQVDWNSSCSNTEAVLVWYGGWLWKPSCRFNGWPMFLPSPVATYCEQWPKKSDLCKWWKLACLETCLWLRQTQDTTEIMSLS